ncbi:Altronate dehydratase [Hartmannibacter diazotrophicus]|uniref:Altronate dehydratase n=1 Tax=Hartmannibacter diazotrophicus TaxID=1482074 RepID=A0A2C9D8S0_9HYPH|nr:altronate dehydratase family protein [Hartmannibacter diazotrophicus]SON56656.1 Altronate dehydratase [Hartmannibacter diazotrophicus]
MTPEITKVLRLHPDDNVGIALKDLDAGEAGAAEPVPQGHKIALMPIEAGTFVRKYGQIIGAATQDIRAGAHVHTQNLGVGTERGGNAGSSDVVPIAPARNRDSFLGYPRPDRRAGTRNFVGILTTVNCSGSVAHFIAEEAERSGLLADLPNIDGVVPIAHGSGCGMAGQGEGYETLMRTLAGYAQHPNFGAILLVGLGCEVMQLPVLAARKEMRDPKRFRFLTIQQSGGTRKTIETALPVLRELAEEANRTQREPVSAEHLVIGLQCGGSDGLSGITANPALGVASDLVVAQGGTTILSETSEIYGAEHLLTRRATPQVAAALMERIGWWEAYCARHGGHMDNNPSPGNKRGGLTTILEKSLGAVAKGGSAPLTAVYKYAEPIRSRGFVFMDSPGYDPCSVTGQVASGANLIVFTTGRGSVSGYRPVPCIKIATNNDLWARMSEDMDINCGDIIDGVPVAEKGEDIYRMMLDVASGQPTKSEAQGFGRVEFVPWQLGAVM